MITKEQILKKMLEYGYKDNCFDKCNTESDVYTMARSEGRIKKLSAVSLIAILMRCTQTKNIHDCMRVIKTHFNHIN